MNTSRLNLQKVPVPFCSFHSCMTPLCQSLAWKIHPTSPEGFPHLKGKIILTINIELILKDTTKQNVESELFISKFIFTSFYQGWPPTSWFVLTHQVIINTKLKIWIVTPQCLECNIWGLFIISRLLQM